MSTPGSSEADPAQSADTLSIVHAVAPAEFGGLESVVKLLACGQRRLGHRVCVAAVGVARDQSHGFIGPLLEAGVRVECLPEPGKAFGRERAWLAQVCRKVGANVVHTHGYRPDVIDSSVARTLGIAAVSTVHGITGDDWKSRFYHWLEWRALRRVDAVVAVSRPLVQALIDRGIPEDRVVLLPNAYAAAAAPMGRAEARRALGLADDALVIGWVGRLSREKGADVLLDALSQLGDKRVNVAFIGEGGEWDALHQQAARLGLNERVVWCGAVRDAGRLCAAFDVFALTSRTEGTPIVIFEALAAGVPIVATRVGGVPDVISEREALLVEAEAPAALAAAISLIVGDAEAAGERATAGFQRLGTEYGVDPWLAQHDALYTNAVSRRAAKQGL